MSPLYRVVGGQMSPLDRTYRFIVSDTPASVNAGGGGSRAHHQIAGKEKKRWEGLFLTELMVLKAEAGMQFCSAHVELHFKRRNHRDEENYRHPAVKPLADALVKGGYLKDDTREWFCVAEFRVVEKSEPWPFIHPGVTGYTAVRLEASYA